MAMVSTLCVSGALQTRSLVSARGQRAPGDRGRGFQSHYCPSYCEMAVHIDIAAVSNPIRPLKDLRIEGSVIPYTSRTSKRKTFEENKYRIPDDPLVKA